MNVSGVRYSGSGERCHYKLNGECQLFSKDCDNECATIMPEYAERLLHINTCKDEIIDNQKEIIDDLFVLVSLHLSAECEEVKAVVAKINNTAKIRAEIP